MLGHTNKTSPSNYNTSSMSLTPSNLGSRDVSRKHSK